MAPIPITICIPLYNGIEYLKQTLVSLQEQTYKEWICLIGVNGHGENNNECHKKALEICRSLKDHRFLVVNFPTIKGTGPTKTALSEMASTEWVAHCDADDVWLPQKLEFQLNVLKKANGQIDVLSSWCVYWNGDAIVGSPTLPSEWIFQPTFSEVNPVIQSSVILKREDSVYTNQYFGLDDYTCYAHLAKQQRSFYCIPHPLVLHRLHQDSHYNASGKQEPHRLQTDIFEISESARGKEATVVTAFYKMPSKFSVDIYLQWVKLFLEQTPCNLVIFTEQEFVEQFTRWRNVWKSRTKIVVLPREQWTANTKWGHQLWEHQKLKDSEKNHSPDLYKIWYEKKEFVKRAIQLNPFNHTKFVWCDIGVIRHPYLLSGMTQFPRKDKIPDDKMLLLQIEPFLEDEIIKSTVTHTRIQQPPILKDRIGGGIQAGSASAWSRWSDRVDAMMETYLQYGWFIGKDQTLYGTIVLEHPDEVELIQAPKSMNPIFKWFGLLWYMGCSDSQWSNVLHDTLWLKFPIHY
jgi:glycosyltransferase involved in cell wall biosynthesis